ncbi:alcohol dehydrogenase catalytic domain-containing protein [Pseudarthrobacter sp. H3Y2-7]|uniref:alcohol dehydrogenase catalytic domain-containing protein n=1 Tax=Pseudarthrobacter naphthalenicus TaxID=3031328 RepID=UPI0023B15B51|nr:alcohol dehydrogenase catalytic domain-containing protein [Pseudarthrobacter sp. H3Y2-7]MDE8670165.1 alcohol dehydrogenase catalytic domain-containing protein [Pseudarthrobacter sp. H3Y2-7]
MCHSDVTALDDAGWMPLFPELPRTMGHENAGVITEVGEGMDHWKVGDRVGLSPVMSDGDALGYGKWDGGFGPKLLATDDNLVKLPDEVTFELGAMATDAGLTAYHAVMAVGGAKAGMKVGVIGLGGLGHIGARVAVIAGAEVYGAEVNPETQKLADEIGLAGVAGPREPLRPHEVGPAEPADEPHHPGGHPGGNRQAAHGRRCGPLHRKIRGLSSPAPQAKLKRTTPVPPASSASVLRPQGKSTSLGRRRPPEVRCP